jgi:hypothetical protein
MRQLIHDECPAGKRDSHHLRTQWSWERDTKDKAWLNNMYWDCLFIAAAYAEKQGPPPDDDSTENALRSLLDQAIKQITEAAKVAEQALKQVIDLLATLQDPTEILKKPRSLLPPWPSPSDPFPLPPVPSLPRF